LNDIETVAGSYMRDYSEGTNLREQAMEALQRSTTLLQVAGKLLDQGNVNEAKRLRDQARAQRNVSVWLMAKANTLESFDQHFPTSSYNSHSSANH
jgi:hypothetical protein